MSEDNQKKIMIEDFKRNKVFDALLQDLQARFTYHAPKGDQALRYGFLRSMAHDLAIKICELCPDSRERSLALTNLDEVIMWANAAIARNE
jgi:hypothetical protein